MTRLFVTFSTENISHMKGNTEFNIYITAISVSVNVALVVTVVFLIFKIRQPTTQQTTRPTNPTKIYRSKTFQGEPVDDSLEEQRISPTNIDSGLGYAYIDDVNVNVRDSEGDAEMPSRPLSLIPSKKTRYTAMTHSS